MRPLTREAIVGQSPALRRALAEIEQVAATETTVLLLGETGTGKALFANRIHECSERRGHAMVRVDCAAIAATVMESELFGRERGVLPDAPARRIGRFEQADRSTIFLDEIGELPQEIQVKLLGLLEERQIERRGDSNPIHVDTRVIAATHCDLEKRIADGSFREDLFYRLNVFPIRIPPLRERTEDIPLLVWRFVNELSATLHKQIEQIPLDSMSALQRYPWPGNIRELHNVIERAMILNAGPRLTIPLPPMPTGPTGRRSARLADVEREHIEQILESVRWRVRGDGGAAAVLGLRPTTLETRMAKLGIIRPERRDRAARHASA